MNDGVFITIKIKVPPGPTCVYPPKTGDVRGSNCRWRLEGAGKQAWCQAFDTGGIDDITEIRVGNFMKCPACLKAAQEAAKRGEAQ